MRWPAKPPIYYGVLDNAPVAYIPLTKGAFAIIDVEDVCKVPGDWHLDGGYAAQWPHVQMQNLIMRPSCGRIVDHRFGIKLDNRKSQLRVCSVKENGRNRKLSVNNTSGYKGVHWNMTDRLWQATIKFDGRLHSLGCHKARVDAAKAYDAAAIKHFGEYARLNFPLVDEVI